MRKKLLPIPTFKTIVEEANFWDTHDSTDYAWQEAPDVKFAKNLKSIYTSKILPIKLSEKIKKAIEKFARKKGVNASDAASMHLQERLMQLKVV